MRLALDWTLLKVLIITCKNETRVKVDFRNAVDIFLI